ncbi:MAG: hypothetical protein ACMG6E_02795 [Candidatus Roizmanbacteria bacterium]
MQDIKQEKNTLSSQLKLINAQVNLTAIKIENTGALAETTKTEIDALGGRIEDLNSSLDKLSGVLLHKIVEGYKDRNVTLLSFILNPKQSGEEINTAHYIDATRKSDQLLALRLQQSKVTFQEQKDKREEKVVELQKIEKELEQQKGVLKTQTTQKQALLTQTSSDESKYQALLSGMRAEYAAIQGIVSGAGNETKLRDIKKGDTIANVIQGASCNSSGTHLHFTVKESGSVINPFSKLANIDHIDKTGGDPWSPSGDWDWPLSGPINFNQGYGATSCARFGICGRIYSSHNGLDISGSSSEVRAVSDGTLYRGGYSGSGGCTLSYVKVIHSGSPIETYYLHVYPR